MNFYTGHKRLVKACVIWIRGKDGRKKQASRIASSSDVSQMSTNIAEGILKLVRYYWSTSIVLFVLSRGRGEEIEARERVEHVVKQCEKVAQKGKLREKGKELEFSAKS